MPRNAQWSEDAPSPAGQVRRGDWDIQLSSVALAGITAGVGVREGSSQGQAPGVFFVFRKTGQGPSANYTTAPAGSPSCGAGGGGAHDKLLYVSDLFTSRNLKGCRAAVVDP